MPLPFGRATTFAPAHNNESTMGYDVHITRKQNWFDDEPRISLGEWKSVVMSDDEMRLDGHAAATVGGGAILRVESEGLAVWTARGQES
jgi:hypothetical protein